MLQKTHEEVSWNGSTYRTILETSASGGAMSIVDSVTQPQLGPPRHVHANEDEAFVVLTGDIEFWMDGKTYHRGPGGTVFIPRGIEHTFRVTSDVPSRHLVILTPGGFEGFFFEMAKGAFRIPEDMAEVEENAQRHHLTFTGPPLGAE